MTEAPKVIWARHLTTVGSVMLGDWGDTVRYVDGVRYIRADAPELVALVEALRKATSTNVPDHIYFAASDSLYDWEALTK